MMRITLNVPDNCWVLHMAMCLQQAQGNTFTNHSVAPKDGMTISRSGDRCADWQVTQEVLPDAE